MLATHFKRLPEELHEDIWAYLYIRTVTHFDLTVSLWGTVYFSTGVSVLGLGDYGKNQNHD